jgi:1-phosphofructokinase family hexose kinase
LREASNAGFIHSPAIWHHSNLWEFSMILTVTPNTALDKVIFIDEWTPGHSMRTTHVVTSVGGKGLDSSVVLRHLGVETVGLALVAGRIGQELIRLLEGYGIEAEPVWAEGETRIAHVIVERKHHRHSHIITGELRVDDSHLQELLRRFRARVNEAAWVICAGSIPAGVSCALYRELIEIAKQANVPVLVDSSHAAMREAIKANPEIVKMNREEFGWTFEKSPSTLDDLKRQAGRVFYECRLRSLVLTCGMEGIIAFTQQGAFHVISPFQKAVNAAGAGDAVSAALVWRLNEGDDCRKEDVLKLLSEVEINPF